MVRGSRVRACTQGVCPNCLARRVACGCTGPTCLPRSFFCIMLMASSSGSGAPMRISGDEAGPLTLYFSTSAWGQPGVGGTHEARALPKAGKRAAMLLAGVQPTMGRHPMNHVPMFDTLHNQPTITVAPKQYLPFALPFTSPMAEWVGFLVQSSHKLRALLPPGTCPCHPAPWPGPR